MAQMWRKSAKITFSFNRFILTTNGCTSFWIPRNVFLDTINRPAISHQLFNKAQLRYLLPLVLNSAANNPGSTRSANINENATEIELTNPKSLITGTGERTRTKKPEIVVPADKSKEEPVVVYISSIAVQIPMPLALLLRISSKRV